MQLIDTVKHALERQQQALSRSSILEQSVKNNCYLVQTTGLEQAFDVANQVAPEHLELLVKDPKSLFHEVQNAGAVFLGAHSPEAMGDYVAGPNHVLPVRQTARFSSGLSVDDFIKKSSLIALNEQGFRALSHAAMLLAEAEGLDGHANSIRIRL
jgi:histidinol dehydrogenase